MITTTVGSNKKTKISRWTLLEETKFRKQHRKTTSYLTRMSFNISAHRKSAEIEKKMLSLFHLRTAIAADMPISLALVALSGAGVAAPAAAAASGFRAIAGHMPGLAAVVAVATAETATGSGLSAIAREMTGFAAIVAIAAAATTTAPTTTTTLRAIS